MRLGSEGSTFGSELGFGRPIEGDGSELGFGSPIIGFFSG